MISFLDNITVAIQTILNWKSSFGNQNQIVTQGNQDGTKSNYSIINEYISITENIAIHYEIYQYYHFL